MGTGAAAGRVRAAAGAAAGLSAAAALPAWASQRWPAVFDALVLERAAVAGGQWWRLWSGHLAHLDGRHATINLLALALLAVAAARLRSLPALLGMSLLLMPLVSLGLLQAAPELQWYAGLSGLLHAWAAWLLLRYAGPLGAAGLCVLAAKLLWEALSPGDANAAFPVVLEAHRIGALAGLLLATPMVIRRARRAGLDPPPP